jgi:hypothetical protein
VRIAPVLTRQLNGFAAEINTVRGPIGSSWAWIDSVGGSGDGGGGGGVRVSDGSNGSNGGGDSNPTAAPSSQWALNVSIPIGTLANVTFPERGVLQVDESGVAVISSGVFRSGAVEGVTAGGVGADGLAWVTVASGDYTFVAHGTDGH